MMHLPERLCEILLAPDVKQSIKENEEYIFSLIPELAPEKGFDQRSPWHCYDVWEHTVHAVSLCEADIELRLALLLHDIGKVSTCTEDEKGRHFRGHAAASRIISEPILRRLGVEGGMLSEMLFLIGEHATEIDISGINGENIGLYLKQLRMRECDAGSYEPSHAKMILDSLAPFRDELYKIKEKTDRG